MKPEDVKKFVDAQIMARGHIGSRGDVDLAGAMIDPDALRALLEAPAPRVWDAESIERAPVGPRLLYELYGEEWAEPGPWTRDSATSIMSATGSRALRAWGPMLARPIPQPPSTPFPEKS